MLAIAPLLVGTSYARLQQSGQDLKTRGDCVSAKREALSSLSLSAKRPQAYAIIGVCDLEQGFAQGAVPAMAEAASLEPQSWEDAFWLAVARAVAGPGPARGDRPRDRAQPARARSAQRRASSSARDERAAWELAAPRLRSEALDSGKFSLTNL